MADSTLSALIAASVALIAVYCTQFLAESYRRFMDGSSLAAGIAGELSSHKEAIPHIRLTLRTVQEITEIGRQEEIMLRSFDKPVDRYFDQVVGKVGALGPHLAERIIYVYSNLHAFRGASC